MATYPTHQWQQGQPQAQRQAQRQAQPAQQPLPPGWEAKYNQSYNRYYFINHATKETTWTDPRLGAAQPPAHHTTVQPAAVVATPQHTQPSAARAAPRQQESIALQNLGPHQSQRREPLETTEFPADGYSGKTKQEKSIVRNKIAKDYELPTTILDAALEAADYNEKRSRALLKSMGCKTREEERLAAQSAPAPSASTSAEESRPDVTEYEEMGITDFSSLYKQEASPVETEEDVPEEEDVAQEEEPVEENANKGKNKQAKLGASKTSLNSSRTSTPTAVSRSDVHVTFAPSSQGSRGSAGSVRPTSGTTPTPRPGSSNLKNIMNRPQRTREYAQSATSSSLLANRSELYIHSGSLASGPDSSLYMGPDAKYLLSEMVGVRGADEYLRNGPRRDFIIKNKVQRLKRGTLAVGTNQALRKGPDAALVMGPRPLISAI